MNRPRRDFLKKIGLSGFAAMNMHGIISADEDEKQSQDFGSTKGLTFLFQGDSITDGNRTRNNDWNHVMGHGYAFLIASRLWFDYPDQNLMFFNRGVSGDRVKDLDARWQKDTIDLKPDVVSILVGVNDVIAILKNENAEPIEKFEETYSGILDKTKNALPNTTIVLCEPFFLPLGWVNKDTEPFWEKEISLRRQLVKKLSEKYDAIFVELQQPFKDACKKAPANYWIWDGIHPMPAGHELIARIWINEVRKKFTFIN